MRAICIVVPAAIGIASFAAAEEAVKAARQWLFDPAMKSGAAVPMLVTIQLTFTLK